MKVAVDGMGGDYAPGEVVKGAVLAAREYGVQIALVGPQDIIARELDGYDRAGADIEVVHAGEYLMEGEPPAYALRQKRNASIAVATRLVRDGKADAVVSAGPTGGVVAAALYFLGTLEDISRPVAGGPFLGFAPGTIMLDLGSNVDCQPYQLLDFAIVGTVYARKMLDIPDPKVALLSIGAEEGKGNELVKASYPLFRQCGLNFIGNVEGYDIPFGKANVIICDGFVGNIVVKFCESLGRTIAGWLEKKAEGKLPEGEIREMTEELIGLTNAAGLRGGGPLWAVNGVACVSHGRSRHREIAGTIREAKLAVEKDLVGTLRAELAAARQKVREAGFPLQ